MTLLRQLRCLRVKPRVSCRQCQGMSETRTPQTSFLFLKTHAQGFYSQTGLLYLCTTAEADSSTSQRGTFTHPLCSHVSSLAPPESSGFSFSCSLSLVSLPLPCLSLLQRAKGEEFRRKTMNDSPLCLFLWFGRPLGLFQGLLFV